jgi:hypothetical protein
MIAPTDIWRCPHCKSASLAVYGKVWINLPAWEVDNASAEDAYVADDAECICNDCQNMFNLNEAVIEEEVDD